MYAVQVTEHRLPIVAFVTYMTALFAWIAVIGRWLPMSGGGMDMQITFDEEQSVSVVTYTISTDRVAESTAAFVNHILEEKGIVLDDLTADQQDIAEQAIDGGYNACEPYSDAFEQLLDRLSTGEYEFTSFVRYQDTWYFAHVSQWVK